MPEKQEQDQARQSPAAMKNGNGKDGQGGKGMEMDDFRLWKEFTRDIEPLEEPDWEALEALIRDKSPATTILQGHATIPQKPQKSGGLPPRTSPEPPRQPPQLDARTEARLRRGKLPIDGTLDLHGHTQDSAHALLTQFVTNAYKRQKRCLLIITGKGRSAAGGAIFDVPEGVLKQKVPQWLGIAPLSDFVLKIIPAQPAHGGSGALYVYLKRKRD